MARVDVFLQRLLGRAAGFGAVIVLAVSFSSSGARSEGLPPALSCDFTSGTSWSYEAGKFASNKPEALKFSLLKIDLNAQSAQLGIAGETGGAGVKIVRAVNANHFLEVVNEGFLNLTTVYDQDGTSGNYPAVHSRHLGILGQPVFSQYTGICRAK